jgi:hypothetical protein
MLRVSVPCGENIRSMSPATSKLVPVTISRSNKISRWPRQSPAQLSGLNQ